MKGKRPPLALKASAFAAHAIPQPDPVKVATAQPPASPTKPVGAETPKAAEGKEERAGGRTASKTGQPSRAGKVQVVAWVPEGRRTELKIVAAQLRRTVDD